MKLACICLFLSLTHYFIVKQCNFHLYKELLPLILSQVFTTKYLENKKEQKVKRHFLSYHVNVITENILVYHIASNKKLERLTIH